MSLEGISRKVGQNDNASKAMIKQLKVRDIPEDFPPKLLNISDSLATLVEAEEVNTLKAFFEVSARFTKVLGKNQELADIERSFLSASPGRIRKYLPLNPSGEGTSLQAIMHGFMLYKEPDFAPLRGIAANLGMDFNDSTTRDPADPQVTQRFIETVSARYAEAIQYFTEGDADLQAAMRDFVVFSRSTRFIEDPVTCYILFKIVRLHHGEDQREQQSAADSRKSTKSSKAEPEKNEGFLKKTFGFFNRS